MWKFNRQKKELKIYTNILKRCCQIILVASFAYGCVGKGAKADRGESANSALVEALQAIDLGDTAKVDTLDFGVVKTGEVLSRQVALANSGDVPVVVTSTETSCGCLRLDYPSEPVEKGKKVVAEMWFDAAGYTFFYPRAFYLRGTMAGGEKKIVVVARME